MRYQLAMQYVDAVARVGSIRKAADELAITSSALNRRILALEEDLGVPIFDRISNGVRLNAAGELYVHHVRRQLADMERVRSQIHDLQGERRGHVSIAASQALMPFILPVQINKYRAQHPKITFNVRVCTRYSAITELQSFNADIAVVFEPDITPDFEAICSIPQQLYVQYRQGHPLSELTNIRLRDCLQWPLALPTKKNGTRHLLDRCSMALSAQADVVVESDNTYLLQRVVESSDLVSFSFTEGLPGSDQRLTLDHQPISTTDVKPGMLCVGQLKGRHLSVAASKFLQQIAGDLAA